MDTSRITREAKVVYDPDKTSPQAFLQALSEYRGGNDYSGTIKSQ